MAKLFEKSEWDLLDQLFKKGTLTDVSNDSTGTNGDIKSEPTLKLAGKDIVIKNEKLDSLKITNKRKEEFISKTNFKTFVPNAKITPKMLSIPVENDFLADFCGTSLEFLQKRDFNLSPPKWVSVDINEDFTQNEIKETPLNDLEREIIYGKDSFECSINANPAKSTEKKVEKEGRTDAVSQPKTKDSIVQLVKTEGTEFKADLTHPRGNADAKVLSVKPILYCSDYDNAEIARVVFDGEIAAKSEGETKGLAFIRNKENFLLYAEESGEDSQKEEGDSSDLIAKRFYSLKGEFFKRNDGSAPPLNRRNVLIVGKDAARFFPVKSDLRLQEKPRPVYDYEKEGSEEVCERLVIE